MLRPSEKPQLALDGENDPRRFRWMVYGVLYALVSGLIAHPSIPEHFPPGSFASILVVWPLAGIDYLLRDMIQYSYEDSPEKRRKTTGFWPATLNAWIVIFVTTLYKDPSVVLAGSASFMVGIFVDGVVFSKMKNSSLSSRLLVSNLLGSVCGACLFMLIITLQGRAIIHWFDSILTVLMVTAPALIIFIMGTALFSRALGAIDGSITRKIQRGG